MKLFPNNIQNSDNWSIFKFSTIYYFLGVFLSLEWTYILFSTIVFYGMYA